MAVRCDRCTKDPVIFIRYSGQHLCSEHFLSLLERRVKKEVRSQRIFETGSRIAVAVSGGKDSLVALKLMKEISEPLRDTEVITLTIDEGIEDYRPSSVEISKNVSRELDLEFKVISFKENFGFDLDQMLKRTDLGPCTVCGILRRKALNTLAATADCDVLITGHNLDDMAQTILMNVMTADVLRFSRMGPHLTPIPGLIPRAMPLRTTPETETYLAAVLYGLPMHGRDCPYSKNAKRGIFRDMILRSEDETPGSRHALLRFHSQISPMIPSEGANTKPCSICGDPVVTSEDLPTCRSCDLLSKLGGKG